MKNGGLLSKTSLKLSILLNATLILLLELALIRYIPSYVINFNYYSNFILLASFLGIGIGLLTANSKKDFSKLFPYLFSIFILFISLTRIGTQYNAGAIILLERDFGYYKLPQWLVVGLIFLITSALFIALSSNLGKLFNKLRSPLEAYSFDLIGSLLGIALFFLFSYFRTPPIIWFLTFFILYFIFKLIINKKLTLIEIALPLISLLLIYNVGLNSYWSPYYRITLQENKSFGKSSLPTYELFVNSIGHQNLVEPKLKEFIYFTQYKHLNKQNYDNVLIIGSGAGNDISIALQNKVKNIDAVEIDPTIVDIGKKFHPINPYSNNRVQVHIDDGRSFLSKSQKKYDMIIIALTDSLTQVSQQSNIRLESYLLTNESFIEAKKHLKDDGILVLYNYYWKDWLVDKIGYMLENVFNQKPYLIVDKNMYLASFIIGKSPLSYNEKIPDNMYQKKPLTEASDNWPFIYLKFPHIPTIYLISCIIVLLFSMALIRLSVGKSYSKNFNFPLFFTGAAFMLLETTAITKFMLLFGTTWIVNSTVIFAILFLALLANLIIKFRTINKPVIFALLFLSLILAYFIPLHNLLSLPTELKYIIAVVFTIGPIFFASLIFSSIFSTSTSTSNAFGSNLLGAMFGGIIEYLALATGYSFLILVVMIFYFLALLTYSRKVPIFKLLFKS